MKYWYPTILASGIFCLAGCATPGKITHIDAVGPAPTGQINDESHGLLQVYSARQQKPLDINVEVYFENEPFLKDLRCEPAHTDYSIYTADGKFLRQVRNSRNIDDDQPAKVTLAPGRYEVEAQTEGNDGEIATIVFPVVIETQKVTVAHLEGSWRPSGHYRKTDLVRLPNGQLAGWRAEPSESLHVALNPGVQ